MNANERRKHLQAMIASLTDHLLDQVGESVEKWNAAGPDNWRGTCDLEHVAGNIAELCAKMSGGGLTRDDVMEAASENVKA